MTLAEIRQKYLAFCEKNGHVIVPGSPLVPEGDATTLFTGSGMQPMLPYLLGADHPQGTRIADSQKCFRAEDIDEIGDSRHTTFFEMLGNWSFGDYYQNEQLRWCFQFLTDEVGIDPSKLYVTCFIGDDKNNLPKDVTSAELWKELFAEKGIDAKAIDIGAEEEGANIGMGDGRIFYYDASGNWWSRGGVPDNMPPGEPGGPDSEVFYDFGIDHDTSFGEHCHPACDCGRFVELGNNVFMEYIKKDDGTFDKLPRKNVDFGGGLERITAASMGNPDVFSIDVFQHVITRLENTSGKKYADENHQASFRVIADHLRGALFMIGDGIVPSNKERGYVLRRLLRRAMYYATQLGIAKETLWESVTEMIDLYKDVYPYLEEHKEKIITEIRDEEKRFHSTLTRGMKEFEKMLTHDGTLSGKDAFVLFTTYGFPLEMTLEIASARGMEIDHNAYTQEFEKHRKLSRSASAGKFKGGLADSSTQTTALHTCTHLMLAGLRMELGDHVHQAGSNITRDRTRFDFTHGEKVSREILDRIATYVNTAIAADAKVIIEKMNKDDAQKAGVEGSFWEKYPDIVNVYKVIGSDGTIYSQELCGGPHVEHTGTITGTFRIMKEESSSAGIRRIKATLE